MGVGLSSPVDGLHGRALSFQLIGSRLGLRRLGLLVLQPSQATLQQRSPTRRPSLLRTPALALVAMLDCHIFDVAAKANLTHLCVSMKARS